MASKEIIEIKFKVDGKEITATEKDLKELQRATKEAGGASTKASKSIDGMSVALKALGAVAAAAAMVKFAADTAHAVKEIDNLSQRAGVSTTVFQKHAFAAKSVGVESDKLADIFKDVNDKLGDFVTTGAGPLADFFEGIGKQMGVTIDDFKELSSDQALGLYVKTLQDANASQAEMTFYMEGIASDAMLLAPLYRDGAKALNEMGEAATGVLSEDTIGKAVILDQKFRELAGTIRGQVTLAVVDATTAMGQFLGILDEPVATEQEVALQANKVAAEQYEEAVRLLAVAQKQGNADYIAAMQAVVDRTAVAVRATLDGVVAVNEKSAVEQAAADKKKIADDLAIKASQDLRALNFKQAAEKKIADDQAVAAAAAALKLQESQIEGFRNLADPLKQYTDKLILIRQLMIASADDPETLSQLTAAYVLIAEAASTAAGEQAKVNAEAQATEDDRLLDLAVKYGVLTDKADVYKDEIAEIKAVAEEYGKSQEWVNEQVEKLAKESPWAGLQEELNGFDAKLKEMAVDSVIGLAQSFAEMAVSGEASVKQMAVAIIKQIAAMIIQALILKAVMSFIPGAADSGPAVPTSGGGGSSGGAPGRMDSGGQGSAGNAFMIGTGAQPEMFVPQTSGQFIPKQQLIAGMGGGGVNVGSINVTLKEDKNETSAQQAEKISKAIARDLKQMVQGELVNQRRSGNMLNPANVTGGFR